MLIGCRMKSCVGRSPWTPNANPCRSLTSGLCLRWSKLAVLIQSTGNRGCYDRVWSSRAPEYLCAAILRLFFTWAFEQPQSHVGTELLPVPPSGPSAMFSTRFDSTQHGRRRWRMVPWAATAAKGPCLIAHRPRQTRRSPRAVSAGRSSRLLRLIQHGHLQGTGVVGT